MKDNHQEEPTRFVSWLDLLIGAIVIAWCFEILRGTWK